MGETVPYNNISFHFRLFSGLFQILRLFWRHFGPLFPKIRARMKFTGKKEGLCQFLNYLPSCKNQKKTTVPFLRTKNKWTDKLTTVILQEPSYDEGPITIRPNDNKKAETVQMNICQRKDLNCLHLNDEPRVQERQQVLDQRSYIPVSAMFLTNPSSNFTDNIIRKVINVQQKKCRNENRAFRNTCINCIFL